MGKNRARNKAKARRTKTSQSDDVDSNEQSTSNLAQVNAIQSHIPARNSSTSPAEEMPSSFTSRMLARIWGFKQNPTTQQSLTTSSATDAETQPNRTSPSTPHVQEPERTSTTTPSPYAVLEQPKASSPDMPKIKRDSVISSTSTGPPQDGKVDSSPPSRPRSRIQFRQWVSQCWPCRLFRWLYHFAIAFTRVNWNDQRRFVDLLLSLGLAALFIFGCYLVLEFVQRALPAAAAQSVEAGNCSVVYVTIPGPIITVSLIGASPTDPAHGTYFFSVVNGTTEWLDGVAPPSRFNTLVTQTPVITPVISSVSVSRSSVSATTSSLGPSTPGPMNQPQRPYPSYPNVDATSTSTGPGLSSNEGNSPPISTPTSISTSISTTILPSSLSSLPPSALSRSSQSTTSAIQSTIPNSISTTPGITPPTSITGSPISVSTNVSTLASSALTPTSSLATSLATSTTSPSSMPSYSSSSNISSAADFTSPVTPSISTTSFSNIILSESSTATSSPSSSSSSTTSTIITVTTPSVLSTSSPVGPSLSSQSASAPSPSASPGTSSVSKPSLGVTSPLVSVPSGSSGSSGSISVGGSSSGLIDTFSRSSPTLVVSTQLSGSTGTAPGSQLSGISSSLASSPLVSSPINLSSQVASSQMTSSLTRPLPTGSATVPIEPLSSVSTSPSISEPQSPLLSPSSSPSTESPLLTTFTTNSPNVSSTDSNSSTTPPSGSTQSVSTSSTASSLRSSPAAPPSLTSFSLNLTSSSTYSSSSSMFPSSAPSRSFSTSFVTLVPIANVSSSSVMLNSSTSTTTSTSTITVTPTVLLSNSSSFGATPSFAARAITRVISYGETQVSFVFPSPNISTTVSYWTGTYPTVTGPLPSELATLPLTTRTARQTPLSEPPSFERFSSQSRCTKTTVLSVSGDKKTATAALVKRQGIPITVNVPSPSLGTATQAPSTVAQPDLPGPSSCGESGNFTIGFDDTVVDEQSTGLLVASGMNNPYHHLFYANGYTYVPDKWEPYPAISQPNVAMFMPLGGRLLPNTPFAGTMLPGELGAGPRAPVNAYWFNAYSGYFGCALNGLTPCTLRISGFRWDNVVGQEVVVAEQKVTIPACFGYVGCRLTQVVFDEGFRALSGIQFKAYTYNLNIPQVHMMDDLQMEWYNNTCSAGILRIGHS